jgi:PAS domain S-box-containing protein
VKRRQARFGDLDAMSDFADRRLTPTKPGRRDAMFLAVTGTLCAVPTFLALRHETLAPVALAASTSLGAVAGLLAHRIGRWFFLAPIHGPWTALAESELRYRVLAEDSADLVLLVGRNGIPPFLSSAVKALLGYVADEARAMPLLAHIHADDREGARVRLRTLSASEPRATTTARLRHKQGHYIWVEATLCRVEQASGAVETIVTIRNITERHREEQALREATLVARRAQAEADDANKAKTEFLACMSHEIRTPLNSVIGFASLLLARADLDPQVRLYSERIQAGGNALLTVVDDILDFSQVEAGVIDLKPMPFSLPGLIDECLSLVQQSAVAKHLSIHVNLMDRLPPAVLGDAARLRQIILNLLNNAIKFTLEGSVLFDIRYDRSTTTAHRLKFSIIDTGIGIEALDLPRLFQRFAQVDASIRRTYGGTGLGLAISKRLVELMGGEIGVQSECGVGSTFWFTVPLQPTQTLTVDDIRPRPIALGPRQILLVEDVPINQDLVRHILEASGHTVDIVGNGAEAIMAVQDTNYDVVLMDIQMPYLDGLAATRIIRDLPHPCRTVPIVAMTANVLPEQTEIALEAGMVDVIHKPFSVAQIFSVLERVGTGRAIDRDMSSPPAIETLVKLAGLIGDAKIKHLLTGLAESLDRRFDDDGETPAARALLRRQAHASIAGSGMLGFGTFAATCKTFEHDADDATFETRLAILRADAKAVAATARDLANQADPIAGLPAAA